MGRRRKAPFRVHGADLEVSRGRKGSTEVLKYVERGKLLSCYALGVTRYSIFKIGRR